MGIELVLLIAWVITHGCYRAGVGTYCAVTKTDPPWVKSRQERLTNREIRRADRKEALASKRTARGFAFRVWGNFWEDCTNALEERRARRMNAPDAPAAPGTPIVTVDAEQAADWARNLGAKAKARWDRVRDGWNRWMASSRKQCPWLTPQLNDDHTAVVGRACGQRVRLRDTYCRPHQDLADRGHCQWADRNDDIPRCMSHRYGHFPFCLPHLEEWGGTVAEQDAARPDDSTCRQTVNDGAGFRTCGRPVPDGAATPDCGQHDGPNLGELDTPDAPTIESTPVSDTPPTTGRHCFWGADHLLPEHPGYGKPTCPAPTHGTTVYCEPHLDLVHAWTDSLQQAEKDEAERAKAAAEAARPRCQWGRGTTSESVDHGEPECGDPRADDSIHCDPHKAEYSRRQALQLGHRPSIPGEPIVAPATGGPAATDTPAPPEQDRPICDAPVSLGDGKTSPCGLRMHPVPGGFTCYAQHAPVQGPEPAPADARPESDTTDVPPQRPALRLVPNTQGDTTVTTPAPTTEITNVQALAGFADKVVAHGSQDWPQMLENAESQMGNAGLTNDPALTNPIGRMREAAAMFAAAGEELKAGLAPHQAAAEQISGLGNTAADKTATYQNQ